MLATDASDVAVSVVLHQDVNRTLAPIAYYSRILTAPERRYNTYEECLVVLFGCEKCRSYLEHKEFLLDCDNLALCWLLRKANDVGRLGRWILRLEPHLSSRSNTHSCGRDDVVTDALSLKFGDVSEDNAQVSCAVLLQSLPLVFSSLEEHQTKDDFCEEIHKKLQAYLPGAENFQLHKVFCAITLGRQRGVGGSSRLV